MYFISIGSVLENISIRHEKGSFIALKQQYNTPLILKISFSPFLSMLIGGKQVQKKDLIKRRFFCSRQSVEVKFCFANVFFSLSRKPE